MILFVDIILFFQAFLLTFTQRFYENLLEILWILIRSSRISNRIYLRMMRSSRDVTRGVTRGANYAQYKYLMSNNKY